MSALEIVGVSVFYASAGAIWGRLMAGHLAWRYAENRRRYDYYNKEREPLRPPSSEDWFWASCVGVLVAVIWPLVLAMRAVPSERWAIGDEARAVARQRERRIAQLEKELDLK